MYKAIVPSAPGTINSLSAELHRMRRHLATAFRRTSASREKKAYPSDVCSDFDLDGSLALYRRMIPVSQRALQQREFSARFRIGPHACEAALHQSQEDSDEESRDGATQRNQGAIRERASVRADRGID